MSSRQLDWLLLEFVRDTPGVVSVIVLSDDGLRIATSPGRDESLGDQLAAAISGLASLAHAAARLLGAEPVTQTIVEMAEGYLFATAMVAGATLAVYADRRCDIGMVGYGMTMLASRVGHALSLGARVETEAQHL